MSALHVLHQVRALDIKLCGRDGRLHYEAPAGRMTPQLLKALAAHKAAILDLLEAERLAARRIVYCRDCADYIPSAPVRRSGGAVWEMPGGCAQGRTSPDRRPPIYPCTGWYCDGWKSRKLQ